MLFEKESSNIKFYENLSSGSRVVPIGRTEDQTDVTKPIVAFLDFSSTPKNDCICQIFRAMLIGHIL
jgi:hypothetical protein